MITTYTVYRTDGTITPGEVWHWPESPTLKQIKALVEPYIGGPLEHVRVLDPAKAEADVVGPEDYRDLFVDELGHVRHSGPKRRNEDATAIYRANWLRRAGGADPEALPSIAGDAVLFHRIIWR